MATLLATPAVEEPVGRLDATEALVAIDPRMVTLVADFVVLAGFGLIVVATVLATVEDEATVIARVPTGCGPVVAETVAAVMIGRVAVIEAGVVVGARVDEVATVVARVDEVATVVP